jgi:hypothetical protein
VWGGNDGWVRPLTANTPSFFKNTCPSARTFDVWGGAGASDAARISPSAVMEKGR